MAGHVFIIKADITKFACDAWLMPCDHKAKPGRSWYPPGCDQLPDVPPFKGGLRIQILPDWPKDKPQPFLGNVGGHPGRDTEWYIKAVSEFLDAATAFTKKRQQPFGRTKHLLALPVVGTGRGGALERAGEILAAMLAALKDFTSNNDIDVAIVSNNPAIYAAAQAERNVFETWPVLDDDLKNEAQKLANFSREGKLAVFIGAGVSKGSGLPDWKGLLKNLIRRTDRNNKECDALIQLNNPLDQATIIERWLEGTEKIGQAVAQEFEGYNFYSLSHALLASLPVKEVITTNYDRLFEEAWKLHDPEGLSVVPGRFQPNTRRWLLKMHGCLSRPEQIVLTRADYNRYNESLPGLAGIVQAFLVTRHMLFVGFSLTDDNFHRIIDCVRRIRAGAASGQLGTVISLIPAGLQEVLWEKDLNRVRMAESEKADVSEAARRLEIFLDYLLSCTRETRYLLVGKRFDAILDDAEKQIRRALNTFIDELESGGDKVKETVAWQRIAQMLTELGYTIEKPSAVAIRKIKQKFEEYGGSAQIPNQKNAYFSAEMVDGGIMVDNLGSQPFLPWEVFEEAVNLLVKKGGRAEKGDAMMGRLGNEKLPRSSIEGHVAASVYSRKTGQSVFRRITPLTCILVWAGVCKTYPNGLALIEK